MTYRVVAGASLGQLRGGMRTLLAPLALAAVLGARAPAADVRFERVWLQWHKSDSFQSFYEYHTGRELTGRWIVMRSQPDERTGLYFLVRVESARVLEPGSTFVVRVITPTSTETKVYSFPAAIRKGSWLYDIGLTGKDWTGSHVRPVAWEVELQSAAGEVIARQASFLWGNPGG